jgi:hypothetical protein
MTRMSASDVYPTFVQMFSLCEECDVRVGEYKSAKISDQFARLQ